MDSNRNYEYRIVRRWRKIGTWKEFMNDRLLSKKNIKKNSCHVIKYNTGKQS
jgi:hypothetical protein